jgi:general nucleoside transport system ATP-binding protein
VNRHAATAAPDGAAVALRGITKRFPGVVANDGVDFEAAPGEVHALLGENGAGKSTLSHILTGLYRPDEGEIRLYGARVDFHSPRDAIDAGVGMVHQHFRLVTPFTVAENVILGEHGGSVLIDPRGVERRVADLGERYEIAVDPRAKLWQLSLGEQQRVEILKALYREAKILILDEPTAVLTPQECESLFGTIRRMADEGRTIIFISHKLHEVKAVSDRVTVLRAGRAIATVSTADATPRSLASLMVGREVETVSRRGSAPAGGEVGDGETVLEVDRLWADGDRGNPALRDVSLRLRAGEVVAVAGVAGNGQRELAETISGMRAPTAGSIAVAGKPLRGGDPREAIARGIAHVPEDRLGTGVAPSLSISENVALKSYRRGGVLLRLRRMREHAIEIIKRYQVKAPGPHTEARKLSGGNLQKVVLAREFSGEPKVLIAASPTRGLDVSAIETVHTYLLEAADRGVGVLLISEDLDEILALADRVVVMFDGHLVESPSTDVEEIGLLMAGEGVPVAD